MKSLATVALVLALLTPVPALATDTDFVDIARQHQAAGAVERVVKAGLVSGFADHTFRGWKSVSRYELIASTAQLMPAEGATAPAGPLSLATDVPASHWAFPALARMHQLGIGQQLWADGLLGGDRQATRFDLAYLAVQTWGAWVPLAGTMAGFDAFADIPAGHWAAPAVRQAAELGLMSGLAPDRFGGDQPIDRYQLAVVLDRLLSKVQTVKAPAAPQATATGAPAVTGNGLVQVGADGSMAPVAPIGTTVPVNVPPAPKPTPATRSVAAPASPQPHRPATTPAHGRPPVKPAAVKPTRPHPAKAKPASGKPVKPKAQPAKTKPAKPKAQPAARKPVPTKAKPAATSSRRGT